jgi:hypothetical protein
LYEFTVGDPMQVSARKWSRMPPMNRLDLGQLGLPIRVVEDVHPVLVQGVK